MSGYEIVRLTRLRFRFFWSESYGQVYPTLRRLEAEGLVAGTAEGGSRGKMSWSLTDAGRAVLASWLTDGKVADHMRLETLLKAFYAFAGAPGTLSAVLGEFAERLERDIGELEIMENQLRNAPDPHKNHLYALMTLEFGLSTYRVWKDWAKRWGKEGR